MKGFLVAVVLALGGALLLLGSRGGEPDLPEEAPVDDPIVEEREILPLPARAEVAPPPPPVAEPEVVEVPVVEATEPPNPRPRPAPEWTPRVSDFVEAGLTLQQAEWLVGGLERLLEDQAFLEESDAARGAGSRTTISGRMMLQLGPSLAGLIKEEKIPVKSTEFRRRQGGQAMCHFVVMRANDGRVRGFHFTGRDPRGAVTLDVPLKLLDQELLIELGGASGK